METKICFSFPKTKRVDDNHCWTVIETSWQKTGQVNYKWTVKRVKKIYMFGGSVGARKSKALLATNLVKFNEPSILRLIGRSYTLIRSDDRLVINRISYKMKFLLDIFILK